MQRVNCLLHISVTYSINKVHIIVMLFSGKVLTGVSPTTRVSHAVGDTVCCSVSVGINSRNIRNSAFFYFWFWESTVEIVLDSTGCSLRESIFGFELFGEFIRSRTDV